MAVTTVQTGFLTLSRSFSSVFESFFEREVVGKSISQHLISSCGKNSSAIKDRARCQRTVVTNLTNLAIQKDREKLE